MAARDDPYKVLGVRPKASEDELRAAYHRLVQAHHPDHNGGSAESARRFEEIQEAYSRIRKLRADRHSSDPPPTTSVDPDLDARLADLEQQIRQAHAARERARRAAAEAASATAEASSERERPSDEELGYIRTDDSFSKILADAEAQLTERLAGAPDHPAGRRISELIDDLAAKLRGDGPRGKSGPS
jgi:curved DNA-binding protein CbpA